MIQFVSLAVVRRTAEQTSIISTESDIIDKTKRNGEEMQEAAKNKMEMDWFNHNYA
jgi:hypothetical protein